MSYKNTAQKSLRAKSQKQETSKVMTEQQLVSEMAVKEALSRARSITIGTCFGGTVEVSMRRNDGTFTFCILQPVEITELIHQMAASIGCHIHLQPRKDFASWRDWKYTEEELLHYRGQQPFPGVGFAPHVNDMAPHQDKGQVLPPPEAQPGLPAPRLHNKENIKEEVASAPKQIERKQSKRKINP